MRTVTHVATAQGFSCIDESLAEEIEDNLCYTSSGVNSLSVAFNEVASLSGLETLRLPRVEGPPLFSNLVHLDVRHNRLRSLRGIEGCPHLQRLLVCGNPHLSSLAPVRPLVKPLMVDLRFKRLYEPYLGYRPSFSGVAVGDILHGLGRAGASSPCGHHPSSAPRPTVWLRAARSVRSRLWAGGALCSKAPACQQFPPAWYVTSSCSGGYEMKTKMASATAVI